MLSHLKFNPKDRLYFEPGYVGTRLTGFSIYLSSFDVFIMFTPSAVWMKKWEAFVLLFFPIVRQRGYRERGGTGSEGPLEKTGGKENN